MRTRFLLVASMCAVIFASLTAADSMAASLKISPLQYEVPLRSGEIKRGFVDISNPTAAPEAVTLSVLAFRQTGDDGSLQFYDDTVIKNAVKLDYYEVEIGAREVLHLAFSVESAKLPPGNTFAAIMAATKPETSAAAQAVRVGTLLFITNGKEEGQRAVIEHLEVPPLQLGDQLGARFALRNNSTKTGTGFFPEVDVTVWPYVRDTVKGPLVFQGVTRQVEYVKQGSYFGVVRYTVKTADSSATAYSLVITGYWRWLAPLILVVLAGAGFVGWRYGRRGSRR